MRDAAELDRHVHVAPQIPAEIDDTHAAAPQLADDMVTVPDKLSGSTFDHAATVTQWTQSTALSTSTARPRSATRSRPCSAPSASHGSITFLHIDWPRS